MNTVALAHKQPDFKKWNERLNVSWSSADYSRIGVTLQIVGEELAEAAGFAPDSHILDVAAGNGNATLAVARRFCHVTSTDYIQALLDKGRARVDAEGLDAEFRIADAQDLPFANNRFDGVISTFGAMFAPDQQATASELLRVCKPGGTIALASWTPPGFIGRLCKLTGSHMSASPGFRAPANWGREEWIREHFAPHASDIRFTLKRFNFRYASPEHYVEVFRTYYGLIRKAFEKVGAEGEKAFHDDMCDLCREFNVATDGTLCATSEYAEVVIVKA